MKGHNNGTERFLKVIGDNQGALFKICLMFTDRSREDIRDLYNDMVCNLWEGWADFDGRCTVATWVYRVALNTAISKRRHDLRRPTLVTLDDEICNSLAEEAASDLAEELYRLADQLEPDEKALLRLYLDKVKLKAIAQILGTTEAAVKNRLHRIKEKLIKLKNEEGI